MPFFNRHLCFFFAPHKVPGWKFVLSFFQGHSDVMPNTGIKSATLGLLIRFCFFYLDFGEELFAQQVKCGSWR